MFKQNSKAIYLQIADSVCDDILSGVLSPGDRLPSVREYAATVQVNPNTMMRTYEYLAARGIIYNRRGIGFFLTDNAPAEVRELKMKQLFEEDIDDVFRLMSLLGVTPDTLRTQYERYLQTDKNEKMR